MAVAVIRPEHAIGANLHENLLFYKKHKSMTILVISGPSRPQKWIRLEILRWKMVLGGLEIKIKAISSQIYDFLYKLDIQSRSFSFAGGGSWKKYATFLGTRECENTRRMIHLGTLGRS